MTATQYYFIVPEARDGEGRSLAIQPSGNNVIVALLDYSNENQLWERRTVADNQFAYINKVSGMAIARAGYDNGSALIMVTVDQIQMSAPKTVWREESWHGYKGINSLGDWEQKFNIPGNGPYSAGQTLITWEYSGADPNECWSFVEDNTNVRVESLEFDFNLQKILDLQPLIGQTQVVSNSTDIEQTQKAVFGYETTETYSFTSETGLKISESVEFKAGIPEIAESKVVITVEGTVKFSTTKSEQTKKNVSYDVPVKVPPGKKIVVESIVQKGQLDIPYRARVVKTFPNGTQQHIDTSGIFRKVNTQSIITQYHNV